MTKSRGSRSAKAVAGKLLAGRDRSKAGLKRALEQRGHAPEEVDGAVREAEQRGWLNDERFAQRVAADDLEAGWAPAAIVARLLGKGVDEPQAQAAVERARTELGWNALQVARGLIARRNATGLKAARFLASRGFDEDIIARAVPGLQASE